MGTPQELHRSFKEDEILSALSGIQSLPYCKFPVSTGRETVFLNRNGKRQEDPVIINLFLIRQSIRVEKQTRGINHADFNYECMYSFNTIERNCCFTVLWLNYESFSLLHYRYESMLPYLNVFSLTCAITNLLHKVIANESPLLQVSSC